MSARRAFEDPAGLGEPAETVILAVEQPNTGRRIGTGVAAGVVLVGVVVLVVVLVVRRRRRRRRRQNGT